MIAEHELIPYQASERLGAGPVLVFAPHPDDEVFGCGGAIARHVEAGDRLKVVILTDGAFGAADPESVRQTREHESRAAAQALGYGEPLFWRLADRGLRLDEALIERLRATIETEQAALVYAPSWWEIHPDHLTLALACAEAVRRSTSAPALALYEVGMPLHPNALLDITAQVARKNAAMACFASQLEAQPYDEQVRGLDRFRSYTLPRAVRAAEAYRLIRHAELLAPPPRFDDCVDARRAEATGEPLALRAALEALRLELEASRAQAQRLHSEIAALHASTSWRLTRPLRALMTALRALRSR